MDPSSTSFQDIAPQISFKYYPGSHVLTMDVQDFTSNDLKVQVTCALKLRISGKRRVNCGKCIGFRKEIDIPADVDIFKISAKVEGGILSVRQPTKASTEGSGCVRRGEWLRRNMVNLALGAAAVFVIVYLNLTNNDHMEQQW
ncbi:Heat shock protein beta-11, partial [Cucurbita argyrosperma subsp. sororia]